MQAKRHAVRHADATSYHIKCQVSVRTSPVRTSAALFGSIAVKIAIALLTSRESTADAAGGGIMAYRNVQQGINLLMMEVMSEAQNSLQ